jgi:DMSO/TMAO reductase YedYZ molybdopterin-dependent catalytic subunit
MPNPTPTLTPVLLPGEVTQYQGQNLTSVNSYIQEFVLHPDVAIKGTQNIDRATYRLTVTGLVNKTLVETYDDVVNDFQRYPKLSQLLCVEGWSVNVLWEGVRISDLLQKAGANPHATTLIFTASDGYTTALPVDYIVQNNLILAYRINNVTLPASTGWPFTLVASNQYGYKWIMWVTEIEVSNNSSYLGYWESRGYPNNATVTGSSNNAASLSVVEVIVVSIAGIAIAAAVFYVALVKPKNGKPKFCNRKRAD